MEREIDKYNLEELESALGGIDKDAYSERYEMLKLARNEKLAKVRKLDEQYLELTGKTIEQTIESSFTQNKLVEQLFYSISSVGLIFFFLTFLAVLGADTIKLGAEFAHGFKAIIPGLLITIAVILVFCFINLIGVFVSKVFFKSQTFNKYSREKTQA